jgi:hypothetical protein
MACVRDLYLAIRMVYVGGPSPAIMMVLDPGFYLSSIVVWDRGPNQGIIMGYDRGPYIAIIIFST